MKYDMNNSKRIYNLIVLKGKCLRYNNEQMQLVYSLFDPPAFFLSNNFFSNMSDAIDSLLFFFLNDEVSESLHNRGPLGDIMASAVESHGEEIDLPSIRLAVPDIEELFRERTDFMLGSNFLDFTVSTFSVFEKWISNIYEELRERKLSKNKKAKKVKKLIRKYNASDDLGKEQVVREIMENCSSYVSGSEKIEFSMSMLTDEYKRDINRDKAIVKLYRSQRNTIHNLGVHNHKSVAPISINNIELSLEEGLPYFTEDFNSNIYICDELVEIYRAMIENLKPNKINSLIEIYDI